MKTKTILETVGIFFLLGLMPSVAIAQGSDLIAPGLKLSWFRTDLNFWRVLWQMERARFFSLTWM